MCILGHLDYWSTFFCQLLFLLTTYLMTPREHFTLALAFIIKTHTHTHTHTHIYIYIYIYHVVLLARISLSLSRHFSLSFIASGRSSGLHPVSSHSCCVYVRAGRPAFAWPYAGWGPLEYITYELVLVSSAVSCMSGSSKFDSFRDGRQVAV